MTNALFSDENGAFVVVRPAIKSQKDMNSAYKQTPPTAFKCKTWNQGRWDGYEGTAKSLRS